MGNGYAGRAGRTEDSLVSQGVNLARRLLPPKEPNFDNLIKMHFSLFQPKTRRSLGLTQILQNYWKSVK